MTTCGALPSPEEVRAFVEAEGLQRYIAIPDNGKVINVGYTPNEEEILEDTTGALSTGTRIILPDSTPVIWNPSNNQPYNGARRGDAWHPRTRRTVALVRDKVRKKDGKKVICATYLNHGRTGMKFGIDILFSRFTQKANNAEEAAGDRLSNWAIRNWSKLNINYMIWWNWMNDGDGWFDYEPLRLKWDFGSPNVVSSRHFDHVHIQVDSPLIPGNE